MSTPRPPAGGAPPPGLGPPGASGARPDPRPARPPANHADLSGLASDPRVTGARQAGAPPPTAPSGPRVSPPGAPPPGIPPRAGAAQPPRFGVPPPRPVQPPPRPVQPPPRPVPPRSDPAPQRSGPPKRPPRAGGKLRAIGLALAIHAVLIGLLVFGLRWTHREPEPVQAELWVPPPPKPPPVPPAPKPEPPPPKPEPPPPPPPKPDPAPPAKTEPAIKVEQARRETERKEAERRLADQKAAERKAEEKRAEDRRRAAEQKAADEKRQKDELARKEAERRAADEKRRAEQARKDTELAEQRRADDIRRLQSQAGTAGLPSDQAVRGAATGRIDAGYGARVAAAIRANTTYRIPPDFEGNPKAVFLVQLRTDCSVASVRLRRSSGVPAWDQAAERGIEATDPFPKPADGRCQGEFEIASGPRDER